MTDNSPTSSTVSMLPTTSPCQSTGDNQEQITTTEQENVQLSDRVEDIVIQQPRRSSRVRQEPD